MAIRKNVSRRSERNRLARMYAEGYSVAQLSQALSITEDHIKFLIKAMQLPKPTGSVDLEGMKAQLKAELMAELGVSYPPDNPPVKAELEAPAQDLDAIMAADLAARSAEKPEDDLDEYINIEVKGEFDDAEEAPTNEAETEAGEEAPKPKRRRRKKAAA